MSINNNSTFDYIQPCFKLSSRRSSDLLRNNYKMVYHYTQINFDVISVKKNGLGMHTRRYAITTLKPTLDLHFRRPTPIWLKRHFPISPISTVVYATHRLFSLYYNKCISVPSLRPSNEVNIETLRKDDWPFVREHDVMLVA